MGKGFVWMVEIAFIRHSFLIPFTKGYVIGITIGLVGKVLV